MGCENIIVIIGCSMAIAFFSACTAGGAWITNSININNGTKYDFDQMGLWEVCYQDGSCKDLAESTESLGLRPKWIKVVRMLTISAAGIQFIGIVHAVLNLYTPKAKLIDGAITLFVGPFLMIIGLAIYTAFEGPSPLKPMKWGWSYLVGWLGSCLVPIYGLFIMIYIDRDRDQ